MNILFAIENAPNRVHRFCEGQGVNTQNSYSLSSIYNAAIHKTRCASIGAFLIVKSINTEQSVITLLDTAMKVWNSPCYKNVTSL